VGSVSVLRYRNSVALAPFAEDAVGFLGELDVAQQRDLVPVQGDGGQVAQAVQVVLDLRQPPLVLAVLLDGGPVRVDDDHPPVAVDDDGVAEVHAAGDVVEGDHRRNA
jgi:hypothetical protein